MLGVRKHIHARMFCAIVSGAGRAERRHCLLAAPFERHCVVFRSDGLSCVCVCALSQAMDRNCDKIATVSRLVKHTRAPLDFLVGLALVMNESSGLHSLMGDGYRGAWAFV